MSSVSLDASWNGESANLTVESGNSGQLVPQYRTLSPNRRVGRTAWERDSNQTPAFESFSGDPAIGRPSGTGDQTAGTYTSPRAEVRFTALTSLETDPSTPSGHARLTVPRSRSISTEPTQGASPFTSTAIPGAGRQFNGNRYAELNRTLSYFQQLPGGLVNLLA